MKKLKTMVTQSKTQKWDQLRSKHKHLLIDSIAVSHPNSAEGIDVSIRVHDISGKTMKYVTFWLAPYNAVGDTVNCSVTGRSLRALRITGPIKTATGGGRRNH